MGILQWVNEVSWEGPPVESSRNMTLSSVTYVVQPSELYRYKLICIKTGLRSKITQVLDSHHQDKSKARASVVRWLQPSARVALVLHYSSGSTCQRLLFLRGRQCVGSHHRPPLRAYFACQPYSQLFASFTLFFPPRTDIFRVFTWCRGCLRLLLQTSKKKKKKKYTFT